MSTFDSFPGSSDQDWLNAAAVGLAHPYITPLSSTAVPNEDESTRRTISHLHHKSDHYGDSKLPNSSAYDDTVHYSEGDNSSEEGQSPGDGKPAPKKAGRKPLTTEPTNKRKAQNRAAQRAFRERKERYVKSLEERIKELEDLNPAQPDSTLAQENQNLKVLVQKLETENYFLKEQSFTFEFPISQPGLYNVAKSIQDSTPITTTAPAQNTVPIQAASYNHNLSKAPVNSTLTKPGVQDAHPWTPPSSGGDSVPNSPLDHNLPTPEHDSVSQVSFSESAGVVPRFHNGTPEEMALFSSLLDGTGNTYNTTFTNDHQFGALRNSSSPSVTSNSTATSQGLHRNVYSNHFAHLDKHSPASSLALFSDHSPSPTLEELVNTPLFETDKHGQVHFTPPVSNLSMPSLTYEQTQALFTDFRDPTDTTDFFANFEDAAEAPVFSEDALAPGLFSDPLLDYTHAFNSLASPPASLSPTVVAAAGGAPVMIKEEPDTFVGEVALAAAKHKHLAPLEENEKAMPCPEAWEQISKHPNFDDVDIDELCAELKSKAKCSGHGPVISLTDVDKLMDRLNQE